MTRWVKQSQNTQLVSGELVLSSSGSATLPSHAVSGVTLQAKPSNSDPVFVAGYLELPPGASIALAIDNTSKIEINGTPGDGINFLGVR